MHLAEELRIKKRRDARLVVLVDDLDRCEPEPALRLLEGIKIYLNLPSCVFVLGMDQRVVERAIANHMSSGEPQDGRHEYAREYLDKLCTNIWHLPLIDNPATPLDEWLPPDLTFRPALLEVVRNHRCVAANPRRIKSFANVLARFVNGLGYGLTADDEQALQHRPELIVLMACLYHDHHDLYRMIESDVTFYDLIYRWVTGVVPSDAKEKQPHELLCSLRLPSAYAQAGEESQKNAVRTPSTYPSFPDPVRGSVFRLQSLVQDLGPVVSSELKGYLLSGRTSG